MLGYLEAAYEVLKLENKPMHPYDIADRAKSLGILRSSRTKDIGRTMWGTIWTDIKKNGKNSLFIKTGRGKFGLTGWYAKYGISIDSFEGETGTIRKRRISRDGITEIKDDRLLKIIKDELREMKIFLKGSSNGLPGEEKLCFWVWLCYKLELYYEGALIYKHIDTTIRKDLFASIQKIGLACQNKSD